MEYRKYAYITSNNYVVIQLVKYYGYDCNFASDDLYTANGMKKAPVVELIKKGKLKITKRLIAIGY